ncbi:MAG: arsenosugar biosynthesis radical SAM protein ArsS [Proteobacteria bacterium]|nr:arsenosugar biosynthesis radical SAM protein ArsS [Pseudomonadota bacterium]
MLDKHGLAPLRRAPLSELQINVGWLCNQACNHCHVDAGPKRTEIMSRKTMDHIIRWVRQHNIKSVDITGGAPEMNPDFRYLVESLIESGTAITSRCNLTVLEEPGQADTAQWYAQQGVKLVCSLPCYSKSNVDNQRGKGVFEKSIRGLLTLNALGYGDNLQLDLMYNPGGAFLPPAQCKLEADYKKQLCDNFGIRFSSLLVLSNLPISRFSHYLDHNGETESYFQLLENSFNPGTVDSLMCRHLISVDWLGNIYDCDFNQILRLPTSKGSNTKLWDTDPQTLDNQCISVGDHCLGCTAGAGSSCGGELL